MGMASDEVACVEVQAQMMDALANAAYDKQGRISLWDNDELKRLVFFLVVEGHPYDKDTDDLSKLTSDLDALRKEAGISLTGYTSLSVSKDEVVALAAISKQRLMDAGDNPRSFIISALAIANTFGPRFSMSMITKMLPEVGVSSLLPPDPFDRDDLSRGPSTTGPKTALKMVFLWLRIMATR